MMSGKWLIAGVAGMLAVGASAAFVKPETTRRYLQGPLSERLLVYFREGKITFGENVHKDAWKEMPYRNQQAHGAWLVQGAADEPFDFRAAEMLMTPDGTPPHAQRWRTGDLETTLAACAPFGLRPTVHARVTVVNRGTAPQTVRLGLLLRAAPELKLIFGAPDVYQIYNPPIADWRGLPATFRADGNGAFRDGERFCVCRGADAVWDEPAGLARVAFELAPGARRAFAFTLGKGETVEPDFDATAAAARADWTKELARVKDRTPLVRNLVVQLLQCFGRTTDAGLVLPRQGGQQRYVWPGETVHVTEALDRLGYTEYAAGAIDFLMHFAQENGQIGPFGNGWAGETAYTAEAFARHCLATGDAAYWKRHWPAARRGFHWIKRTRAETAAGGEGIVPGLFPPRKSTDSQKRFQHWGMTDLVNEHALAVLAAAAAKFGEPEADEIRTEWQAYRAVIEKTLARWRAESAGKDTFFIPLAPDGRDEAKFRADHFFYLHPGAFAEGGYLNADEMLRLRTWLIREGIADPCGLYMRHTSERPELGRHVWYTTWSEYQFSMGWRRVGRADLARQALDALLAYSVTKEGYVGERIHEQTPWFYPWSPNASGSARILKMLLDEGLAGGKAK